MIYPSRNSLAGDRGSQYCPLIRTVLKRFLKCLKKSQTAIKRRPSSGNVREINTELPEQGDFVSLRILANLFSGYSVRGEEQAALEVDKPSLFHPLGARAAAFRGFPSAKQAHTLQYDKSRLRKREHFEKNDQRCKTR
jgi:hypothetical protein